MARYKVSGCAIIDEERGWPPLLKDRSASEETLEFVAAALNTRTEAEQMAKAEVAAFKEKAKAIVRRHQDCGEFAHTWRYDCLHEAEAEIMALPADDSSLREHDAALLKRFEELEQELRKYDKGTNGGYVFSADIADRLAVAIAEVKKKWSQK